MVFRRQQAEEKFTEIFGRVLASLRDSLWIVLVRENRAMANAGCAHWGHATPLMSSAMHHFWLHELTIYVYESACFI